MRKACLSLLMVLFTLVWTAFTLWHSPEEAVKARIVTVQRADVHQVIALAGKLAYRDEQLIYAPVSGVITQNCAQAGQRVASGEALLRFDMQGIGAAAALAEEGQVLFPDIQMEEYIPIENTVLRAETDATVRQLFVKEGMPVAAGTPVMRLSSNDQQILCSVSQRDADKLCPGMWGWISAGEAVHGVAAITEVGDVSSDPLTGLNSVLVMLRPEQHLDLPEGAIVDVDVYLAGSDDATTLPIEAVTERETVWWVTAGRCTEIPAEIVMTDEIRAWVHLPEGIDVAVGEFTEGQLIAEASP